MRVTSLFPSRKVSFSRLTVFGFLAACLCFSDIAASIVNSVFSFSGAVI